MSQTPEEKRAKSRAYWLTHKEQNRARCRQYRATHRDEIDAQCKSYRLLHPEKNKAQCKKYLQKHREENKVACKPYYSTHKEQFKVNCRKCWLWRKYELTEATFNVLLENQGGVCAICGKADWNGSGPHIDHDHVSGRVRGILCHGCNVSIGQVRESIPTLERMIEYLKKHNSERG